MYKIVFTKQALKDLDNLKKSGISAKAKVLVDIIRENPYQIPPRYEKLVGKYLLEAVKSECIFEVNHHPVYYDHTGRTGTFKDGLPGSSNTDCDPGCRQYDRTKLWNSDRSGSSEF